LQAAISASQAAAIGGRVAQIYIPTPDAIKSTLQYDQYYHGTFAQPATYIRFSSTVEESTGCQYNMTSEDDAFLRAFNAKSTLNQCSEDQFEETMQFFEDTAQSRQPFASVDNPPVLSYEDMEASLDSLSEELVIFVKEIYDHWKSRRLARLNRSLMPILKVRHALDFFFASP
jgi:enhancer of polycomb-like protein